MDGEDGRRMGEAHGIFFTFNAVEIEERKRKSIHLHMIIVYTFIRHGGAVSHPPVSHP